MFLYGKSTKLGTSLLGFVMVLYPSMLEFVLFVLWYNQTYENKKYFIYPRRKLFGVYIRHIRIRRVMVLNRSLNYYMVSHLKVFSKRGRKRGKITYLEAFMQLHEKKNVRRAPSLEPEPLPWQEYFPCVNVL